MKIKSVNNFRDFSKMKNKDNLSIKDGLFFRCGHLNKLTKKDSLNMQNLGIKYVIDLRSDIECNEQPDKNYGDFEHIHIPILTAKAAGITQDKMSINKLLDTMPTMDIVYRRMAEDDAIQKLKEVVNMIVDADGGIAFHCTAGKDRTGIIAMLILSILDFKMEDIVQNYLLTNAYMLKPANKASIGIFLKTFRIKYVIRIRKLFTVDRSYMDAFINEINKTYGSLDLFIENGLGITLERKISFKKKVLI